MKKVILCGHTGSHNRGCEAIIKSTADLFSRVGVNSVLATHDLSYDKQLGIDEFSQVVEYAEFGNHKIRRTTSLFLDKILNLKYLASNLRQLDIWKQVKGNIALNVGGDTYCYDVLPKTSINLNKFCNNHNIPCIFWGCSIEKEKIDAPIINADLHRYSLIMPREILTYRNLVDVGFPSERLVLMADPAFTLEARQCALPKGFVPHNTVGINLSPLVMEWSGNENIVWTNYCRVIDYIINDTDMNVCLIPHVYRTNDYDMIPHTKLFEKYKGKGRVSIVGDTSLGCKHLKYIISQCRFLITARTHASIAAYSSLIPTLVLGYSVKSKGIAIDLFGTNDHYVVSTDNLESDKQLLESFLFIMQHEQVIALVLAEKVPIMQQRVKDARNLIILKYGANS